MHTILITDPISEQARQLLTTGDFEVVYRPTISSEELKTAIQTTDAILCRARTKLTADILHHANQLSIIANASTGTDHIDLDAAQSANIHVAQIPVVDGVTPNTIATAEHTVLLILAALRNLKTAMESAHSGNWQNNASLGNELYQKTVGIIGLGKIGQFVAQRLAPFSITILASDPITTAETAKSVGASLVPLKELLAKSDIITVHVPKMQQTINLLDQERLALTKSGVIIVNTSRGEIIERESLYNALQSGHVSGAALDVFTNETSGGDMQLISHPHVIATPHIAGVTEESLNRMSQAAAKAIITYFSS